MRVRHIIAEKKIITNDTLWCMTDLPPRHAPIYVKSRPIKAGWKWRSAKVEAGASQYTLVALCHPAKDNWQAILIYETPLGASVVARFEHHGSHPGIHAHGHCERGGLEIGASSMDNLVRVPKADEAHRRNNAWTENTFWEASKRFFRVTEDQGPLFNHAS